MSDTVAALHDNLVLFRIAQRPVAGMPLQKPSTQDNLPVPIPADPNAGFDLEDALMRGLLEWQTATLPDGRAVLVVVLAVPNGPPETRQILMSRVAAYKVAEALEDVAEALHPVV